MKKKRVNIDVPNFNWDRLDVSGILTAIAGDCAAVIRKRIEQGDIRPQLKLSTIMAKQAKGSKGGSRPLYDTGLMKNSITHKKVKKNVAKLYIKDERYPESGTEVNYVAYLHENGAGRLPQRKFWGVSEEQFDKIAKVRFRQGIRPALKRAGII